MTKKGFSLSDNLVCFCGLNMNDVDCKKDHTPTYIHIGKVKEFITLLKNKLPRAGGVIVIDFAKEIDKLAGNDLI